MADTVPTKDNTFSTTAEQVSTAGPAESSAADSSVINSLSVPEHFIRLPCCAFSWDNCKGLYSCGTEGSCLCTCIKQEGSCCRPINDPTTCCLCLAGTCELVQPKLCMKAHERCCCLECYCSLPFEDTGYTFVVDSLYALSERADGTNEQNDAIIAQGDCCTLTSYYYNWPSCLGCYCNQFCFCCLHKTVCCKPMCCASEKKSTDLLCLLFRGNAACLSPAARCRNICQICCIDERCGCPADDEAPCACATCCYLHHVNYHDVMPMEGCCLSIAQVARNNKNGVYTNPRTFGYNNKGVGVGPGVRTSPATPASVTGRGDASDNISRGLAIVPGVIARSAKVADSTAVGTAGIGAELRQRGYVAHKSTPFQPAATANVLASGVSRPLSVTQAPMQVLAPSVVPVPTSYVPALAQHTVGTSLQAFDKGDHSGAATLSEVPPMVAVEEYDSDEMEVEDID